MPSVLPPAARKGILVIPKDAPFVGNQIPPPGSFFGSAAAVIYYAVVCIGISQQLPKHTEFLTFFLNNYVIELEFFIRQNKEFHTRMMVVLKNHPNGQLVVEYLNLKVKEYIEILKNDTTRPSKTIGVLLPRNFGVFKVKDNHSVDIRPREGSNDFQDLFDTICLEMFPHHSVQERQEMEYFSSLQAKVEVSDIVEVYSYTPPPPATIESSEAPRSSAAIVAPNATMPGRLDDTQLKDVHRQVVPASAPKNEELTSDLLPSELISVYSDDNDVETTKLTAAIVLQEACVATQNARDLTIRARFVTDNHPGSSQSKILLNQSIAALKNAKNETDSAVLLDAVSTAGESIPSQFLVADSDHISNVSILCQIRQESDTNSSASSATQLSKDEIPNDAEVAAFFADVPKSSSSNPGVESMKASNASLETIKGLQLAMDPKSLPIGFSGSMDNASSTIASILAKIEDLKSGTSFSLPDGGRQAPSTTFAQSPMQGVEDGAPGAQQTLFSSIDLERSVDVPNSFGSNSGQTLTSGQSGTSQTHELADLLASLTPPRSTHYSSSRGHDIGVGGAHSSDNPSKNALFHVDVRGNTHADHLSFSPPGENRGPPVQVLASSEYPPGNSSSADQSKTLSSDELGSDSRTVGKRPPAFLLKVPNRISRFVQILQSQSKNPSKSNGIGGSNPVAHLSDTMLSESDDAPPLPSSIFPLGGKIGGSPPAYSPGNPPEIVPPSAPSSSSALRSAATPAAETLNETPPTKWGGEIGGIKRSGKMPDIAMVLLLFSHNPPAFITQAVFAA